MNQSEPIGDFNLNSDYSNLYKKYTTDNIGTNIDPIYPYNPNLIPTIEKHYPAYYGYYTSEPNKTDKAFKIVAHLVKENKVKIVTIQEFIELVNNIVEVL